jgi:hypothetical protein
MLAVHAYKQFTHHSFAVSCYTNTRVVAAVVMCVGLDRTAAVMQLYALQKSVA